MVEQDLAAFIEKSPTPWHAVGEVRRLLLLAGFNELKEADPWKLKEGEAYFTVRGGTSLCAFRMPAKEPARCCLAAAHTDSPGFKLKPNAEYRKENMIMLGLEVYGGPLLSSWLNRELGIAGRIVCKEKGRFVEKLVRLEEAPVVIPQLAIHLDKKVNEEGLILNKQEHLAALAGIVRPSDKESFLEKSLKKAVKGDIIGWDLFVYPLDKMRMIGMSHEMYSGYRLDNLCSVHAILEGLLSAKSASSHTVNMAAFWDHEEIGSETAQGAGSPFVPQVIERIAGSRERYFRLLAGSLCVSVDVGHAVHPNYPDKHEPRHPLYLNGGVILKTNAQRHYATDASSSALIEDICRSNKIPLQRFVNKGDLSSGSTIGSVAAPLMGMPTVDIGIAQLSMHACREVIAVQDQKDLERLLVHLFT